MQHLKYKKIKIKRLRTEILRNLMIFKLKAMFFWKRNVNCIVDTKIKILTLSKN